MVNIHYTEGNYSDAIKMHRIALDQNHRKEKYWLRSMPQYQKPLNQDWKVHRHDPES